jgi:RNA polymerase sigma-70 factor (ECF subfamily)
MVIDSDLELMLRVRDRALAEDLAQEAFLRVYKSRHRYEPDARFATWLYRIATNLALNAIRDRRGEVAPIGNEEREEERQAERVVDPKPSAERQLMQSDRERLIRRAVEALPENQRLAVILHKYQEVEYRQVAKVLSVSESAVKSLLYRAYETLRVRLEPLMKEGQI